MDKHFLINPNLRKRVDECEAVITQALGAKGGFATFCKIFTSMD
ncbi:MULTISPECIES: hypothetical protein [Helicobacter]|jgi:hypothetical protein|uniref:Uncharacterized protein n=1 Tax=Helicobacter hepaticus (strain ATCC 51449 / 3B1) TaxID=235279 RepID=Q7VI57_HELHP|nr:hypothetical protein [Helicobacter hepaticus]AAP77348.1 hypothetical protein HH_0751 [Helicobacter hepaticus ATCC 51449]